MKVNPHYSFLSTFILGLFFIGFAYQFPNLNIKMDISYAVYIYHMVWVNIAVELGLIQRWDVFVAVIAVIFLSAYFSTKYVNKIAF